MKNALCLIALLCTTACASIVSGTQQEIAISTVPEGADCALSREGAVIGRVASTPGSVKIEKNKHDITVSCVKDGFPRLTYVNESDVDGTVIGNAIAGGLIGWGIDSARGADNKYESPLTLDMATGKPVIADKTQVVAAPQPQQQPTEQAAPVVAVTPASLTVEAQSQPQPQPLLQPAATPSEPNLSAKGGEKSSLANYLAQTRHLRQKNAQ